MNNNSHLRLFDLWIRLPTGSIAGWGFRAKVLLLQTLLLCRLPEMDLQNLVSLEILVGHGLQIEKKDFRNNMKLRYIGFYAVTFVSIAVDTFTDLPQLKHLSLENVFFSLLQDPEYDVSVTQLHCGCQNRWLRAWLERNPSVIAPKSAKEVREMGIFRTDSFKRKETYVPVDCMKFNVTYLWGSPDNVTANGFTLNDPCK